MFGLRRRLYKVLIPIVILLTITTFYNGNWLRHITLSRHRLHHTYTGIANDVITTTESSIKIDIPRKPACALPFVDPFSDNAMKYYVKQQPLQCHKIEDFARIDGNSLVIDVKHALDVSIRKVARMKDTDYGFLLGMLQPIVEHTNIIDLKPGLVGCVSFPNDGKRLIQARGNPATTDVAIVGTGDCQHEHYLEYKHDGLLYHMMSRKCIMVTETSEAEANDTNSKKYSFGLTKDCIKSGHHFLIDGNSSALMHQETGKCIGPGKTLLEVTLKDCQASMPVKMNSVTPQDVYKRIRIEHECIQMVVFRHNGMFTRFYMKTLKKPTPPIFPSQLASRMPNIALIMLDSVSNANFQRQLPLSYQWLNQNQNTFIMKGHSIAGDGTLPQLTAVLTGRRLDELPESRFGAKNRKPVDHWPFLFKPLHKLGYATLFDEDEPLLSAFSWLVNGFEKQPTHHYTKAFRYRILNDNQVECVGNKTSFHFSLDYLIDFFETYNNIPRFSLTVLNIPSHNNMNRVQTQDASLADFLRKFDENGHLDNTFLFVFGDHGLRSDTTTFRKSRQGGIEERLPFLSITGARNVLIKNKEMADLLEKNSKGLSSHFDIHATLSHIPLYPDYISNIRHGKSLLTHIDHFNRTCNDASIPQHYCPCQKYDDISVNGKEARKVAHAIVGHINNLTSIFKETAEKCKRLHLEIINQASRQILSNGQIELKVALTTSPNNGSYEATAAIKTDSQSILIHDISRTNLYGEQPSCIHKDYPKLRKYCFCKS